MRSTGVLRDLARLAEPLTQSLELRDEVLVARREWVLPVADRKTSYALVRLTGPTKKKDEFLDRLADQDRKKRARESAHRLAEFHRLTKTRPKHLHLKLSQGMGELPQRVKAKASWLRMAPNSLIVACLRDCLEAMDDPSKALVPPPIVVEFWTVSHAKSRPKAKGAVEAMMLETFGEILRQRSGPILDTVIRLALAEKWDATLEQILRDADVITKNREMKSRLGPLRR